MINPITTVMGIADLVCIILILYAYGFHIWTYPLIAIMVSKGVMSLL